MTAFPVFEHFAVSGYGMYPGTAHAPGLDVDLQEGLTMILGANGLGKTTLVSMIYRLCAGPFDIPGLDSGGELGGKSLKARKLTRDKSRLFAQRVVDGAENATARLRMDLNGTKIEVGRRLSNLDLVEFRIDGEDSVPSESAYQELVVERAGIPSFGDWILMLRHLTFYFEDRRALVWDPSAQRQLLRLLFLPVDTSEQWARQEREILKLDSRMRNLQSALSREESELAHVDESVGSASEVKDELGLLYELHEADAPKLELLNDQLAALESNRQTARLEALQASLSHESAFRDLERLQLKSIEATFPSDDATASYLFAKLFAGDVCLSCGHTSKVATEQIRERIDTNHCVVCGSTVEGAEEEPVSKVSLERARRKVEVAGSRLDKANSEQAISTQEYEEVLVEVERLQTTVAQRSSRIDLLVRSLPPDDEEIHKHRSELAALRARIQQMKRDLDLRREEFSALIRNVNRQIVKRKTAVQAAFSEFAEGFLLETCDLVWSPQKSRVGEGGDQIDFPAFELEMSGTDFDATVRRSGPQQVSESQREFIDLAFRMALMRVAGTLGVGSLVIDAPESSLDAVFVSRAADVLTRFVDPDSENRLVITSNLVEGNLIPELFRRSGIKSSEDPRVVDLLTIAAPTAATSTLATEYESVKLQLFDRASGTS